MPKDKLKLKNELKPRKIDESTWYYLEGNKVTVCRQMRGGVITIVLSMKKHIRHWFKES